jgi:ParB-like chromosome segregation protein Spo0J
MKNRMIALSSIIVNEINPRSVKDADYNRLKRSLQKDPEILTVRPLVLHSKNNYKLLAGEQRYNALLDLGYKEVPVNWISFADELNDEQKRRFVLLDNDHAGIWDLPKLTEHWNADELNNWENIHTKL